MNINRLNIILKTRWTAIQAHRRYGFGWRLRKISEASWQLEEIRSSGAFLSTDYLEQIIPIHDPSLKKHIVDGLIKAGLKASPNTH